MTRTDTDGTWTSPDGGRTWLLTEPSQAWLDARANAPEPEPERSTEDRIAELEAALAALLGGNDE